MCKMKSIISGVVCLLCFFVLHVTRSDDVEIQHLSKLLQNVSLNNETENAKIKEEIEGYIKKLDTAFREDDTSLDNSKRILKRIDFCRKALLYIKDNIKNNENETSYCKNCIKDPDINNLTEMFDDLKPDIWTKIDQTISKLLVDATATLKQLKDEKDITKYKKRLYCNAERMNLSSQEIQEDNKIDLDALLTSIKNYLENVQPTNKTANQIIASKISDSLKILDPIICEDAFTPADYDRTLKKVLICKRALTFLRIDNSMEFDERFDCRRNDDCVNGADTRPLLFLLYDFTPEIAGKINDFIGKILVDVAVDLKSLRDGKERVEYMKQLDFNINRLNLIW